MSQNTPDDLTVDSITRFTAQLHELTMRVLRRELPLAAVRRGVQHLIVGGTVGNYVPASHFTSLAQQLQNVRSWNSKWGWGFTEADFARATIEAATFVWPGDRLQAIVLVPSLATVAQTYVQLSIEARSACSERNLTYTGKGDAITYSHPLDSNPDMLRLVDGLEFKPNTLAWRLVDLGAHYQWDNKGAIPHVKDMALGQTAAHAEVIAALAHFPAWARAVGKKEAPFVVVPGYQASGQFFRGDYSINCVPAVRGSESGYCGLDIGTGSVWPGYAVALAYPMALGPKVA